jgi:hypothetical protein
MNAHYLDRQSRNPCENPRNATPPRWQSPAHRVRFDAIAQSQAEQRTFCPIRLDQ